MKPLLVHQGEALIARLVRQLEELEIRTHAWDRIIGRIVVVVSPLNAAAICDLLGNAYSYVVQPEATGPGDALVRGLEATSTPAVLTLMGDNVMHSRDLMDVASRSPEYDLVVGTSRVDDAADARRFTRVRYDRTVWNKPGELRINSEEGINLSWLGPWEVWCGPLRVRRDKATHVLQSAIGTLEGEAKIGPFLQQMGSHVSLVPVQTRDIGVPEAIR